MKLDNNHAGVRPKPRSKGKPGSTVGLTMLGGGARGAYQAGVLKRIGELKRIRENGNPFPIISGASAGAINGAALAAGCHEFSHATKYVANLWSRLRPSDIFRCDILSQAHNSITWILDLSFGGLGGGGNARSLLDATPLGHYLAAHIDCGQIQENIDSGHLYALAISATDYGSGKSYLFIEGKKGHPMWNRSRRVTVPTKITIDHICASAAIPLVFPPVKLETPGGSRYLGDGCVRLQQPLSPAIRLGADRLLAIGVRCEARERQDETVDEREPTVAQIMGVLFNVMFLDHLSTDIEHLERLNSLIEDGSIHCQRKSVDPLRALKILSISPSVNLSDLARDHQKDMPYVIQYFVNGLGRDASSSAELMSYLMFTSKYTSALADIGYHDAANRIDEIEEFIFRSEGRVKNSPVPAARAA